MRFSRVPPGEAPASDAYNLIVAACLGDERASETIASRVQDWLPVAAYLAGYAAIVISKVNETNPRMMEMIAETIDVKYQIPV